MLPIGATKPVRKNAKPIQTTRNGIRTDKSLENILVCSSVSCHFFPDPGQSRRRAINSRQSGLTQGGEIPEGAKHDWNLGPTGARGWINSSKMETSEARQIFVTEVAPGSPADGIIQPGDVLLGVDEQPFAFDPRTELGKAIGSAEDSDGKLSLIRWRDGETSNVAMQLAAIGSYSATAPFDCSKSKRIFEQGCEALANRMKANPTAGNPIIRSYNALALLSSGQEKYLPLVREQVESFADYSDLARNRLHFRFYGPVNFLMAEYILATGDQSFMPDLERITMEIVNGQSEVGSWGHRFTQANGKLGGYGMMNAPGLPLTVSLILAREAGVNNPALDTAIEKSARLIRFYVGKGSVPYGTIIRGSKRMKTTARTALQQSCSIHWMMQNPPTSSHE